MPRYYCDYCDTYLTHDSPSVRKQHNAGYKHKANVRTYYQQFEEQQTQSIIDQKVKEHQHMAAFQFKPMVPRPGMGLPGSSPTPMLQPMRPPVMHPTGPGGGYPPGGFRPPVAPLPGNTQPNGVYRPPGGPVRPMPGPPAPNGMPPSSGSFSQQPVVPGQSGSGGGQPGGGGGTGGGSGGGGYGGFSGGYTPSSGGFSQPPPGPGYGSQPPPPRPGMSSSYGYSQPPPGNGD